MSTPFDDPNVRRALAEKLASFARPQNQIDSPRMTAVPKVVLLDEGVPATLQTIVSAATVRQAVSCELLDALSGELASLSSEMRVLILSAAALLDYTVFLDGIAKMPPDKA